jgi:hypothetical protein
MGGKHTEHVYWILPELARFITSTYYRDDYPDWLEDFNRDVMPGIMDPLVWESVVPAEFRGLARPDSLPFEGDGVHTTFPHISTEENVADTSRAQHYVWAIDQPRSDEAVMALARTVIDELDLGQRDNLDYLAISLSAVDRVGHAYGPRSQEVLSTILTVDRVLGDFFAYLDEEVGEGRWLVGFTADHGVVDLPEVARADGVADADRIAREDLLAGLGAVINQAFREVQSEPAIATRAGELAVEAGLIESAYTHHDLTRGGAPADSFAVLYRNSYYPGRAWGDLSRFGVELRFGEADYIGGRTGTNHETVYWYDRHVPIAFIGAGVEAGVSDEAVYTVDFAPTLAGLAGIEVPEDLDGRRIR